MLLLLCIYVSLKILLLTGPGSSSLLPQLAAGQCRAMGGGTKQTMNE
jgi:hypothetical protein